MARNDRKSQRRLRLPLRTYLLRLNMVCFTCRKAFRQPHSAGRPVTVTNTPETNHARLSVCPECATPMFSAGKKFKPPRREEYTGVARS